MSKAKGEKSPSHTDDPFLTLAKELGMTPRKISPMKTVFHVMYGDYRFDVDQTFEEPSEIITFLETISKLGLKPQPAFQKNTPETKTSNIGKMGVIKFIDEGKTKNDKDVYFVRILIDGLPDDTPKADLVEIMSYPIAKGRGKTCLWEVGGRVEIIKNDKGYMDIDDATNMTEGMSEEDKKK